jgi:hypothetical protein
MYHAGLTASGCWDNMDEYDRNAIEKFAELIIKECADALFDESTRLFELYSEENNLRLSEEYHMCSNQCLKDIAVIEKHFGIDILELKNE